MIEHFPYLLTMIVAIVMLIMLAEKIKVAYPVLLVVAGLVISFIPGIPVLHIEPELIFIIFLPPLLYEAAWAISWKELWRWRRIICSFAFLVVFFTALCVAIVANSFIPGFTLALGFLLGGIISPPDAVSASAILKFVKVPRRMSSILEGESLLNDASSLIIFRFALIAVATGQFDLPQATLSFLWMVAGGVGIGLALGWVIMKMHQILPTNANIDIIITLVTPYIMYIAAEDVHSSGVLSVVSGGLFLSIRRYEFLSSSARLRGYNVWESLVFLLNGLVFLMIGLDLPEITEGLKQEGIAFSSAIGYGLLITAVLIIVRFLSSFGAVFTSMFMGRFIQVADRNPGFKAPILMSWTGMRGVVSLAAALSIPVQLDNGSPFPQRNLILFITFVVILTTLLLQGLTLPTLIKKIGLPNFNDYIEEEEAHGIIQRELVENALNHIKIKYQDSGSQPSVWRSVFQQWEAKNQSEDIQELTSKTKVLHLEILNLQREWLLKTNKMDDRFDEEIIKKHLHQLDIMEEKLKF
ncbi:Na+/H+ antiporter [Runella sp. MFBS21]|uniref:Na+/H+ antiporter n=1 Tax=Runella sp. MFBS21 TaxID=3034018 RepID=UPI0023F93B90|nr:Na+/H+ antiporter [Runella sp. MFBS21]MDF7819246.1 Na+/H+ antiporter [Runella sp. MFBS21]